MQLKHDDALIKDDESEGTFVVGTKGHEKNTISRLLTDHIPTISEEEEAEILSSLEAMSAEDQQIVSTSQYVILLINNPAPPYTPDRPAHP